MMALLPALPAAAADQIGTAEDQRYVPGQVLVGYEQGTSSRERAEVRRGADAELERRLTLPRVELLDLDRGVSVSEALAALRSEPEVAFAEPDYVYELAAPNDARFEEQWALNNEGAQGGTVDADIDALEAWDLAITEGPDATPGSSDVVVGVVDSGVAMQHPDLAANIWVNPEEDGQVADVDDGPNGFVDDLNGWDFVGTGDDDPVDEEGHGTHVAGTIGAQGDNSTGVAGVNWDVSLMVLRACNSTGSCINSDVAEAFEYAGDNGAHIVNASLSGSGSSLAQQQAIADNPDTLFVFAAGNDGTSNDLIPRFPCNVPEANVICVGASTDRDGLSGFSNYGAGSVDLVAPGGGSPGARILSTYMDDLMNETFTGTLSSEWLRGGTPDTWDRTFAETALETGPSLTDSPAGDYAPDTDNWARFGPVDLSAVSGCRLRYGLDLDVPDLTGDALLVETSTDDVTYSPLQAWNGVGSATKTPSINGLSGQPTVYVRFRMVSDSDAQVGDGAYVDTVRIRCPSEDYESLQGTSMATPHVAGAAALLLDQNPGATVAQLREWLLAGTDTLPGLDGLIATSGRLNLERSLQGALGADIFPPQTSIAAGPALSSRSTSASFSFTSDEPGSFECSLNAQAYAPCASPTTYTGLAIGQHSFRVRAIDLAGNVDKSPAAYAFTVEAPPQLDPCANLRLKLKKAKTKKQKRKLRKKIKQRCGKASGQKNKKRKQRTRR
jgi:subtilisin family serine protease